MTIKTERKFTPEVYEHFEFPYVDSRGRKVGARIARFEATYTEVGQDARSWYSRAPGHYFAFHPWATRNGQRYGASQREQFFSTEAEREAAIQKYLKAAFKRASKK